MTRTTSDDVWAALEQLDSQPPDEAEFLRWLELEDAVSFLMERTVGMIPIYATFKHFFLNTVLVPATCVETEAWSDDLLRWNMPIPAGWGYGYTGGPDGPQASIDHPLQGSGSQILESGQAIVYLRYYDGRPMGTESYQQLDQRIEHILELHWEPSLSAYCRLDDLGNPRSIVKVASSDGRTLVTMDAAELDFYMYLTETSAVRLFDVTRWRAVARFSDPASRDKLERTDGSVQLFARRGRDSTTATYMRGFQLLPRRLPNSAMVARLRGESEHPREYATFIAKDWKHETIAECSCDPTHLGNYFVASELPYETSPAFFRADVLLKYKQDPHKYTIQSNSVTCRGAWSLDYYVNEAGQVHAYLIDLSRLPFSEQLYWKSHNEPPRGSISETSFRRDFLGEWYAEEDPLAALTSLLEKFPAAAQNDSSQAVWSPPGGHAPFSRMSYVVTDARKEWEDQILELEKIVVEGFSTSFLRKLATSLGKKDSTLGSLKLLRVIMLARDVDQEVIDEIVEPLENLRARRSRGIAHPGAVDYPDDRPGAHRELLAQTAAAMGLLADLVRSHVFDIPSAQ